jgi:hypothetical protein
VLHHDGAVSEIKVSVTSDVVHVYVDAAAGKEIHVHDRHDGRYEGPV